MEQTDVHHKMHVEIGRDDLFDLVQEAPELDSPVPSVAPADDRSCRGVEGSEQQGRVVARIVVRAPFDLAASSRTARCCRQ